MSKRHLKRPLKKSPVDRVLSFLFLLLVNAYQSFLSVFVGGNCRYYPSCSEYSKEAFKNFTWWKAVLLTAQRVSRCHPLGSQGYDPVPPIKEVK